MITVEEMFIIERLRTLGFLFRFSDPLCWKLDGACLLRNCVLFDEGLNLSRERVMKSRCRTAVFCCEHCPAPWGYFPGILCVPTSTHRPDSYVCAYLYQATICIWSCGWIKALSTCSSLWPLFWFFLLYFFEKHLRQTVIGETRCLTAILQHRL